MDDLSSASGAFRRPTLIDYLLVAEEQHLDLALCIYIGALELGLLGVAGGRVVHAEVPGSRGDAALTLLARMPGVRVEAERSQTWAVGVRRSWRELVGDDQLGSTPGQAWRLDAVRSELAELLGLDELDAPRSGATEAVSAARPELVAAAAALLDWAAVDAYLGGDIEGAHNLSSRRDDLCPTDVVCAANFERLQLRLLADDLAAAGDGEGES